MLPPLRQSPSFHGSTTLVTTRDALENSEKGESHPTLQESAAALRETAVSSASYAGTCSWFRLHWIPQTLGYQCTGLSEHSAQAAIVSVSRCPNHAPPLAHSSHLGHHT